MERCFHGPDMQRSVLYFVLLLPSFHALASIHSLSPLAHLCWASFECYISNASKGTLVLFGRVPLLRQNKASLVIQSTRPLAPSLEAIPVRSLIIRQGQQLINSSSAVSPLCFLMAPAYVLDAVWLGCSACWLFYFVLSASSLLTRPYMFVIWSPAHLSYFSSRSFELSFSGVSAHSFKKKKRVAVQSTIL